MNELGYVKLYRKLLFSRAFQNEGLLKVWIWCLLRANHEEAWVSLKIGTGTTEVFVGPGQFIFGRDSAAKELKMAPSTVWKRIKKLKNLGNCDIQSNSHYSIITIINWDTYQDRKKKGDSERNSQGTAREQAGNTNKNDKNDKNISPEKIVELKSRYQTPSLIDKALKAIASTRKSNRIAESIVLSQLEKWQRYPVHQVEDGIRTYLEKDYSGQGKGEAYLLGIIRNGNNNQKPSSTVTPPKEFDFSRQFHEE